MLEYGATNGPPVETVYRRRADGFAAAEARWRFRDHLIARLRLALFAAAAAMIFLGESVSTIRWAGVILIMLGAGLISYSEQTKPKPPPTQLTKPQG